MPIRRFDGVDDRIITSLGACNLTSEVTFVTLGRLDSDATNYQVIWRNYNGGTEGFLFYIEQADGGGLRMESTGAGSGEVSVKALDTEDWCLWVWRKAAGSAKPRVSKYVFATKVWSHTNAPNSIGNPSSVAGGSIDIGYYPTSPAGPFPGDFAAQMAIGSNLSDGEVEALATVPSLASWLTLSPAGLWLFNQSSVSEEVKDQTAGGANQTSRTGTEVIAEEPPIPYTAPRRLTLLGAGR